MIDDALVLRCERLRDEAESLRKELRHKYPSSDRQVTSLELRKSATSIAERWLVEIASRSDVAQAIGGTELAERNVNFQRLLTYAERATVRRRYDTALTAILRDFRGSLIVPLKARRSIASNASDAPSSPSQKSSVSLLRARLAFVGKSFAEIDAVPNNAIERLLKALGLIVITGEKPKADAVSKKVRDRIDKCDVFVGVFTRKDKLEGKEEWATSPWVVDEKAYALARNLKLVLLREVGVSSIGGLQGDYEFIEFDRTKLEDLVVKLVETFRSDD